MNADVSAATLSAEQTSQPHVQPPSADLTRAHLAMFIDVYKHHFDLFVKTVFLYFAAMGTAAGYVFRTSATLESKMAVCGVAAAVSIVAVVTCIVCQKWVLRLENTVTAMCIQLALLPFPFSGAKTMPILTAVVGGCFALAAIALLISLSQSYPAHSASSSSPWF